MTGNNKRAAIDWAAQRKNSAEAAKREQQAKITAAEQTATAAGPSPKRLDRWPWLDETTAP
jgi:hypothetical protein